MLYYCRTAQGNVGDDLNPWLWRRLAPELCDETNPVLFIGIGTILSHRLPREPLKVVFGSGCGYVRPPTLDERWRVYCVRGPLTARRLGLSPDAAVTDPALLARTTPLPARPARHRAALMLHHESLSQADWPRLCQRADLHCIDPRQPVEQVLAEIQETRLLLTEAMHGAILADALRVPWIPVRLYSRFLEFKWRDWTQSIQTPLELNDVPPVFERPLDAPTAALHTFKKSLGRLGLGKEKWKRLQLRRSSEKEVDRTLKTLQSLARAARPCLSPDAVLRALEQRLQDRLAALRDDWAAKFADGRDGR